MRAFLVLGYVVHTVSKLHLENVGMHIPIMQKPLTNLTKAKGT